MGKVRSWDFRFHEGRIACMLDLHGLLTNEFVRMLAQCCPTVVCFRNGFTAGCSQAGELFYQLVREGAHTLVRKGKVVCKPVTVKRRPSALEFGLTFFVTYSQTLGVSHTQIHFLSESQGCGCTILQPGGPCAPPGLSEEAARWGQLLFLSWTFRGAVSPKEEKFLWSGDLGQSLCHLENCYPPLFLLLFYLTFFLFNF